MLLAMKIVIMFYAIKVGVEYGVGIVFFCIFLRYQDNQLTDLINKCNLTL